MNRRNFCRIAVPASLMTFSSRLAHAQLVSKHAEELGNGEFNWFPERSPAGPLLIIVSIPDQLVHVYRNGIRVAASTCSTGKPGHRTPTGVFTILQKDRHHRSSTYSNAPMPNMNRLTWSGIALHAGQLPGYPASHGCVRLPLQFSDMLFSITKLGMTVVIADNSSQPASVVHPGMVLGDYARHEFAAVDVAIKRSEYAQGHIDQPKTTSIVVSRADRSVTVLDNGEVAATGNAVFEHPHQPVGNHVFTLTGTDDQADSLHWVASNFSAKQDKYNAAATLRRIKANRQVREEIRRRAQHGMTLVVTDEPAPPATRTANGFVVIDGPTPQ